MKPDLEPRPAPDDPAAAGVKPPPHLMVQIPEANPEESFSVQASLPAPPTPGFWSSRPNRMTSASWNPWSPLRTAGSSSPRPSTPSVRRLLDRFSFKFRGAAGGSLHRFASPPGPSSAAFTPVNDKRRLRRSLSAPQSRLKQGLSRRGGSPQRTVFRVVPTPSPAAEAEGAPSPDADGSGSEGGEEIAAEEAVCRICLGELGEGGDGMKLQCNCKGDLALAHRECAMQWFRVKGNKTCDVCMHDVDNLPVTLLRLRDPPSADPARPDSSTPGTWGYLAVLLVVSVLSYCSLLQLLFGQKGMTAAVVAMPCGILLGLLASFTSAAMGSSPRNVFLYAAVQFAFVLLCVYLFISQFHLHILASALLATSAGFALAMCARTVAVHCLQWRRRRQALGQASLSS